MTWPPPRPPETEREWREFFAGMIFHNPVKWRHTVADGWTYIDHFWNLGAPAIDTLAPEWRRQLKLFLETQV